MRPDPTGQTLSSDGAREAEDLGTVIFVHAPRTAGSTLHRIIERQYPLDSIATRELLNADALQRFKDAPPEEKRDMAFLKGHLPFGVHESLPTPSTYITVFRDPVERVISYYHYLLRRPQDELSHLISRERMSLETFVESKVADTHTNNGLTRLWAGEPFLEHGPCSEEMLQRACDNLRRNCLVVGLTERFDETLMLLKKRLQWRARVSYRRENVTHGRPGMSSYPSRAISTVRTHNELDQDLYRFAAGLFQEQIAQEGAALEWKARWFRLHNPASSRIDPYAERVIWKAKRSSMFSRQRS